MLPPDIYGFVSTRAIIPDPQGCGKSASAIAARGYAPFRAMLSDAFRHRGAASREPEPSD
jgi:hypothetical protein